MKRHTEIYNSYGDFLQREDKTLNGVSPDFAARNPGFVEDNSTNKGCWNTWGSSECSYCWSCDGCHRCENLEYCIDCTDCTGCMDCTDCKGCNEMQGVQRRGEKNNMDDAEAHKNLENTLSFKLVNIHLKISEALAELQETLIEIQKLEK